MRVAPSEPPTAQRISDNAFEPPPASDLVAQVPFATSLRVGSGLSTAGHRFYLYLNAGKAEKFRDLDWLISATPFKNNHLCGYASPGMTTTSGCGRDTWEHRGGG